VADAAETAFNVDGGAFRDGGAQGRPVGQGQLVDVEGMVGVKIVRLFDYE
jgi:hypothetical protein